jgi:hypothetical protein
MTLEVLDTLSGSGGLGALPKKHMNDARTLVAVARSLTPVQRRYLAYQLDKAGPVPAELGELDGWFSDVKKKAGKALKKLGAAKILAVATLGIPVIGPLVGPLAIKAVSAAGKLAAGDKAGAAKEQAEIRVAAQSGAAAVQDVTQPASAIPGLIVPGKVNWLLIGGLAIAGVAAAKLLK